MNITEKKEGEKLTVTLEGRLDTITAPELEKKLSLEDVKEMTFDFAGLQYISSAGLRVLLSAQKKMNAAQGKMTVRNVNDLIMEVFEATGFTDILTIENN